MVGEVVQLREEINWRERAPLFGKRVVVTRDTGQAFEFSQMIERLGGEAWEFPAIKIEKPASWASLDRALDSLGDYSWMIFTSVNGVKYFFLRLEEKCRDIRELAGIKLAAIGSRTARALEEKGLRVDFIPKEYRAERVAEGLLPKLQAGDRVLLPRAAEARQVLPEMLEREGMTVEEIPVYQTVPGEGDEESLKELLREKRVDIITFTSSSTAVNFLDKLDGEAKELLQGVKLASIGPVTSKTLEERGFPPQMEAREYTLQGLVDQLTNNN